jgi:peptide/nickel transport system substrate-binding protein
MISRRNFLLTLCGSTAVTVLAACSGTVAPPSASTSQAAPQPTPPPAAGATVVAPAAQPTPVAAAQPAPTPAGGQPKRGGIVRVAVYQEPTVLNPLLAVNTISSMISAIAVEGLWSALPDGRLAPALAAEIPTQQNGGVSADGRTVIWKLKPGSVWSDGQPFTSKDVVFTYKVIMDPANPVNRAQYLVIDSVQAIDDTTVQVVYKSLFSAYRQHFNAILPEHVFGGATSIDKKEFSRAPVGTGPFKFNSWSSGESIVFDRNPLFRQQGQPFLDQLIFKITPTAAAAIQAFKAGEVDAVWSLGVGDVPVLQAIADAAFTPAPSPQVEVLRLNASCPGGPQQGDPSCPHPILSDLRVRQAIDLAVDRRTIVERLLGGRTIVATSILAIGPWAAELPPIEYSPDKARQILMEAGWIPGSDGIRVKDGVRAHLDCVALAGDQTREQTQQVLEEQLRAVGLELGIKSAPAGTLAGWATNGSVARGAFDIFELGDSQRIEPQAGLASEFGKTGIPSDQNPGGGNYTRLLDPEIDRALDIAAATLDDTARKAAYKMVAERVNAGKGTIVLYLRPTIDAFKTYVQGHAGPNVWDYFTWDMANWWLGN